LRKISFLCTRETSRKLKTTKASFQMVDAQPIVIYKHRASRKQMGTSFRFADLLPMSLNNIEKTP